MQAYLGAIPFQAKPRQHITIRTPFAKPSKLTPCEPSSLNPAHRPDQLSQTHYQATSLPSPSHQGHMLETLALAFVLARPFSPFQPFKNHITSNPNNILKNLNHPNITKSTNEPNSPLYLTLSHLNHLHNHLAKTFIPLTNTEPRYIKRSQPSKMFPHNPSP